ncbi:MAG: M28 family peptidase [Lentisphaerae bacterium]|nr:M28 family peptidase [Lentisphaerota bacterium]
MREIEPVLAANLERHLRVLTEEIGVRLAGAEGERRATDYLAAQGRALGASVRVEPFPVRERHVTEEHVDIQMGGAWTRFPCSLFSNTPGTEGLPVDVPLCFFEAPAEYRRPDLSHLRGKGVVHLGTHIESRAHYQRLIDAQPAFLMFVDIRYPGSTPLADGMFPAYTRAIGAVPTVNVAYQDAWGWRVGGATAARLTVVGGMRDSTSHNVVLDLPGDGSTDEFLLVGGHHDTQADSVGADDNGTGAVAVLELARVLSRRPRRRGIRLISFGAEEQLSVGSAVYVRQHREELQRHARFMWNIDSIGSPMGWTQLIANGPPAMTAWLLERFERDDLWAVPQPNINPYSDHFPFVVAGVPSVFLHRSNCIAGRFFHHRPDDDLSRVSFPLVAALLDGSAGLLGELATCPTIPFPREIEPAQAEKARRYWEDLFGGWEA